MKPSRTITCNDQRADAVFAAGEAGLLLHFDGNSWKTIDSGTTNSIEALASSADGDVYLLTATTVLRYDGTKVVETYRVGR